MYVQKLVLTAAAVVGAAALSVLAKRAYESRRGGSRFYDWDDEDIEAWMDDFDEDDDYDADYDEDDQDYEDDSDVDCESICPECNCGDLCGCRKHLDRDGKKSCDGECAKQSEEADEVTEEADSEEVFHKALKGIIGAFEAATTALEEIDAKYPEWRDKLSDKLDVEKAKANIEALSEKVKDSWGLKK